MFNEAANRRPKYTKYEISKLVRHKFQNSNLSENNFCKEYDVDVSTFKDILIAKRSFNKRILTISARILGKDIKELISEDVDTLPGFRSDDEINKDTIESFNIANLLFNEIIMQEKISE